VLGGRQDALTMGRFLLRRFGQAIGVLFLVTIVTFGLVHALPGGPARAILGIRASPAAIRQFDAANGYNKSLPLQYVDYIWNTVRLKFGFSYKNNESVGYLLGRDLPKTAYLAGLALLFSILIAVPLGIYQAVRRGKVDDYVLTAGSFIGYSMPSFWLALLLIAIFAVDLKVFPATAPQTVGVGGALSDPSGMVLPVATLTIIQVAAFSRYMRSSAIENLAQDYIRTARAKGARESSVLFSHMLRNAVLPIITLIGLSIPTLLTGNLIVEQVFNYPGAGLLYWNSAVSRDYPTLLAETVIIGVFVIIGNLLADLAYSVVDPRIRN
jgi:peptide/nickel transport system permease protein